jgi:hypothetical protein
MSDFDREKLDAMCLEYKCPDGFEEIFIHETFNHKGLLALAFNLGGVSGIVNSKDKHFMVFTHIEEILTPDAAKNYSKNGFIIREDQEHISVVRRILKCLKGENARNTWKNHVKYYSNKDTKDKFNADTAIICSLILPEHLYYQDIYSYCKVLIIHKKGRGYLPLFCFYDDKAVKNLTGYMTAVESMFRYRDCTQPLYSQPHLSNFATVTDTVITVAHGNKPVKIKNSIPSDAVTLFDGGDISKWENVKGGDADWTVEDGVLKTNAIVNNIQTRQKFGDCQLHLEWKGDASFNTVNSFSFSYILFQKQYEVVMMPGDNETSVNFSGNLLNKSAIISAYDRECEWQVFDIVFIAPRFSIDGKLEKQARLTVFLNGILVQYDVPVEPPTDIKQYPAHAELPLELVKSKGFSFKNIWIREFKTDDK